MKYCILLGLCMTALGFNSDGDYLIRAEIFQVFSIPPYQSPPKLLIYDDGSPGWFSWAGSYRGVWFNLHDFINPQNHQLSGAELWFYHHSEFPWDTSSFDCEAWLGDVNGSTVMLVSEECTVQQYAPVNCQFDLQPYCPVDFWIVLDMEGSSGGWPSILSDNSGNTVNDTHSFFSDDFIVWEPWVTLEAHSISQTFHPCSWSHLKTLF